VTAAATPTRDRAVAASQLRERWRMGPEARGLILVMAVLLSFGLAVLYSASAIDAMQRNKDSWFYIARQLSGVGAGMVAVAIGAKLDAERFRGPRVSRGISVTGTNLHSRPLKDRHAADNGSADE